MLVGAVLTIIGFLTFGKGGHDSHGEHGHETHGMAVMQVQEKIETEVQAVQDQIEQAEEEIESEVEAVQDQVERTKREIRKDARQVKNEVDEKMLQTEEVIEEHIEHATETVHDVIETSTGHADGHGSSHTEEAHAEDHRDDGHDTDHATTTHGADDGHGHGDHGAHGDGHGDHGAHDAHAVHAPTAKQALISNFWVLVMIAFWTGVAAMFFIAASTVAWAGWFVQIQKVSLALTAMIPVAIVLGIVAVLLGSHDLFHWTHEYLYDTNDGRFDALLMSKRDWLNMPRFTMFGLGYVVVIMALFFAWWRNFRNQDLDPSYKHFSKSRVLGAISIVLIAILNAFGVWDWIMSMEPHWYSTLYGWYVMASAATVMFAATILIVVLLKEQGYLPNVNENHIHDLGKYTFAISVFWTYLFFSQLMLIWYGNIPEETLYFRKRWVDQPIPFYLAFLLNFIMPLLILMKRSSKRSLLVLVPVCVLLIFGHYLDFWNMMVPAVVPAGGFNLMSIGLLLFFVGLMGFVVFTALSKVEDLESSQHPYMAESLKHHI